MRECHTERTPHGTAFQGVCGAGGLISTLVNERAKLAGKADSIQPAMLQALLCHLMRVFVTVEDA